MEQSRIDLMENKPVKTAVLKLAIPTMMGMALLIIYNLTDMFFIGQTGDKNLVAALAIASPIFLLIQAIGSIFANGTASYISRKLGEKNGEEAKRANAVAVYTAAGVGFVCTVLLLIFKGPILSVIGTSEATYAPTDAYYTIIAAFAVPLTIEAAMAGLTRSEGVTGKAMIGMLIGVGLNIVLDPVFILELNMGAAGAAWATGIGVFFALVYFTAHFLGKKTALSISPKYFKPSRRIYSETAKIGVPAAMSTVVMSISFILVNVLALDYGDHVVAGNGIQMRVNSMVIMLVMGLAQGFQPFAGYNYGAKKFDRLKEGFKTTMLYSTVLCVFFTLVFIFFGQELIGIFINDAATVAAGTQILHAFTWCVPVIGIEFTLMVTFQATGKALKAMFVSLGRQCVIYIPLLFILNSQLGFEGFIFAQPISDLLTTVVAVMMSITFIREMNTLHAGEMELAKENT